jgi:uncharacterized protein
LIKGELQQQNLKKSLIIFGLITIGLILFFIYQAPPLPKNHGVVDLKLFLGESENQPLVVAFGGSEGGNVWASDKLKEIRNQFLQRGYAFLAVGYFGSENTPPYVEYRGIRAGKTPLIEVIQDYISKNYKSLSDSERFLDIN